MRAARFYQIRLPVADCPPVEVNGKTSTGVTGRYLFSPDMGWHWCSPQRLLTFELLDVEYERSYADESEDERERWYELADELEQQLRSYEDGELCFSSGSVCGDQPDDLNLHRELRGKFTAAVVSSDVDIEFDDGDERGDSDVWDEAREYAQGNWRV